MTKVLDLVTVPYDRAFLLFPIDSERYELAACVHDFACSGENPKTWKSGIVVDEKIYSFIKTTHAHFWREANSLISFIDQGSNPLGVTMDVYRRVKATGLILDDIFDMEKTLSDRQNQVCWALWGRLHNRLMSDWHDCRLL